MSTNLLETMAAAFSNEIVEQASPLLGESESGTESALGMLLPALLGGVATHGSTPDGASALLNTLSGPDIDSNLPHKLTELFSGGERTDALLALGPRLAGPALGEKLAPLLDTVTTLSGIRASSVSTLLYMVTPLIFGYLKKLVSELGLDATGLAHLLEDQKEHLTGKVDAQLAGPLGLDTRFINSPLADPQAAARETQATAVRGAANTSSPLSRPWPWLALLAGLVAASTLFRDGRGPEVAGSAPMQEASDAPAETLPGQEPLPARIYFEVGSAAIDDTAQQTISNAIFAIRTQSLSVTVTGYTDRTGNAAENIELAKQRASAVRAALIRAGVAEDQIQMRPPLSLGTTGSGSDEEARRVDISPVD